MSTLIKELWYKWRARVYAGKVQAGDLRRLAIKEQQLVDKGKSTEYLSKYKEINKV